MLQNATLCFNGLIAAILQISGMNQLWEIALRASNTDVSVSAIQYLNSYYIGFGNGMLEKEEEFVQRCMESLVKATEEITQVCHRESG